MSIHKKQIIMTDVTVLIEQDFENLKSLEIISLLT